MKKTATANKESPAGKAPAKRRKPRSRSKPSSTLSVVIAALEDMKATQIKVLDVHKLTDITDTMVVASGSSDRHVRSIAARVIQKAKESGARPFGVEGEKDGEWVLVDLPDVLVHVMLPRVREFYGLEKLWDVA